VKALFILAIAAAAGPALGAADAEHGKAVFAQCAACHTMDPEQTSLGPHLKGVVGRKAGGVEAYVYSPPMRRAELSWTAETLDAFLQDPQAVVPGNKMPFSSPLSAQDRADLIAYLSAP
jgi:cytochrome c2